MSLIIRTTNPAGLLSEIKAAIDKKTVETWEYDSDGDFTHTPPQWYKKAYLRPKVAPGELQFGILGIKGTKLSKEIYGVYHGRFIEMLLVHFDSKFSIASATAKKTDLDNFE
ncbi:hypothetical protein [Mucilaginibacter ginsenosidivorans]|uniref:Uncharacterized protein n=1 Tax=Mucilaginibacter ginsenosidivorans TaxID=398053 RepID=A0A5B8UTM1_9SPHI|nr:hypothetical protein [Mucilaginibacter ginsenosidivorans]QEC61741.1 hypothetical protein FRZ54_03790 [Mucilaginibacter ginsenosidivorans]